MSHRISAFKALIPVPLTRRDFTILTSVLPSSVLLVQAATIPTERGSEVAVPIRGQSVYLPTKKMSVSGMWTFDVPDNVFTTVRYELLSALYYHRMFSVSVFNGNLVDAIDLVSGDNSWLGNLSILFKTLGATATGVVLNSCFISSIDDVQVGASDPETALVWRVSVRYNYVSKLTPLL